MVEFDLTDKDGNVNVGAAPKFDGQIRFGLFRVDGDIYLLGGTVPSEIYACYSGNDIPWSNGKLVSSCGFAAPINKMQVRPQAGDVIRVEEPTFEFSQTIKLSEKR